MKGDGPFVKAFDKALKSFNVSRQACYGGTFIENPVHRCLEVQYMYMYSVRTIIIIRMYTISHDSLKTQTLCRSVNRVAEDMGISAPPDRDYYHPRSRSPYDSKIGSSDLPPPYSPSYLPLLPLPGSPHFNPRRSHPSLTPLPVTLIIPLTFSRMLKLLVTNAVKHFVFLHSATSCMILPTSW